MSGVVTISMIYHELLQIHSEIEGLKEHAIKESIEEISLTKAARFLHVSPNRIMKEVKNGKLKAMTYRDSKRRKRYRFRVSDLRAWQENRLAIKPYDNDEKIEIEPFDAKGFVENFHKKLEGKL